MNLGYILRKHRKNLKLTMKEIAEKAGITEGFLSQIENNVNTPSVDTLMNICNAMGVNAGDILNQVEKQKKSVVIRKTDWSEIDVPKSGFATRRFYSPEFRTNIDSAILVIEPGKSIPVRKNIKNSQELLCVLDGKVELELGKEKIELPMGDSIHFMSNPSKQRILNIDKKKSIVLWIGTL